MNSTPAKDHRQFARIRFDAKVQLEVGEQTYQVHLIDIALKGALVESSVAHVLALGDTCRLVLSLAHDGEGVTMSGKVVHLEPPMIGIECQNIDVVSLTRLRRLIELNSGDPSLMDRELSRLFAKDL